ncbi:15236_t:CDS:1, partial [Cetraspora pellucida]
LEVESTNISCAFSNVNQKEESNMEQHRVNFLDFETKKEKY